jgi:hypothetical protein
MQQGNRPVQIGANRLRARRREVDRTYFVLGELMMMLVIAPPCRRK